MNENDATDCCVATMSGWDGGTTLGVFLSMSEAVEYLYEWVIVDYGYYWSEQFDAWNDNDISVLPSSLGYSLKNLEVYGTLRVQTWSGNVIRDTVEWGLLSRILTEGKLMPGIAKSNYIAKVVAP